jgi:glycosyltransferase involved in cell wall biosynthesis
MNIFFVHEILGNFGGAESNLLATATELRARGHRVGLLTQKRSGKGEDAWEALFGGNLFWLSDGVARATAAFRPDVLYMHKWEDQPSIEELLRDASPLVRMVHDHDIYCLRSYRYHPLTRKPCTRPAGLHCVVPCLAPIKRHRGGVLPVRWAGYFAKQREIALSRRFDRSIVATEFMKGELRVNGFDEDRIAIIPPVPPPPAEPLRSSFSDRNLLLFAGQIIRGKGVDVLLRSLAQVRSHFEAVIVGEGHHRAACEKLNRKLGLEDRVKFTGFLPPPKLQEFYRETSVVVVPSVWPEPMGLVGLEAMRAALPVVAFDVGGISAWLDDGETGFLVPPMETARFAQRIDELLTTKSLARKMGERGLERVMRDFDFDRYIDALENLFANLPAGCRELQAA